MTIGRRIVALMMAAMLAAGAITGCGREAASSQAVEESASSLSQQQGQEPAEEDGPLVLTDQAGRTVTLEEPAQRIVSAYYLSSSLLIALGAEDRVVGIEMKADTREIYKRAAPQFLELPAVGSGKGINVEETAALEPDLVILPIKLQESAQQFDALGIPCLVIDPETLDGFLETIRLVGEATGTSQRAADLAAYHQQVMEDVGARTAACDTRPTVYIGGSDFLSTAGSGMYQDELITVAGGTNVAGELEGAQWTDISAEQLIAWNPERIYMVSYAGYSREEILADSRFASLQGMANDGLYFQVFPSGIEPWDYPTPSSALGILWLAAHLHPDAVSAEEYAQAAVDFYKEYYGVQVSTEDLMLDGMVME